MLNKNNNLKIYYSIGEVAQMFGVNESLLRYWEKRFPQLSPKKAGRDVRQYTQEDIEMVRLIYFLVKEQRLTISGALQRLKHNKEQTMRNYEIARRLKAVRAELVQMLAALNDHAPRPDEPQPVPGSTQPQPQADNP